MDNFDKCLAFTLKEEGGNDDDPNDHGGRTSRGITQREWDKYLLTHPGLPTDVWHAPDADIRTIYHDEYWMPHCPSIPSGLDLIFFDFAVNAGPARAIKTFQSVIGITVDGAWGPQTQAAIQKIMLGSDVVNKFCDQRESFYRGLAQFARYGKGWTGRNERCRKDALSMVGIDIPSPRANPLDVKKKNTNAGPIATSVVIAAGTATVASATGHDPLIFLGIVFAGFAVGMLIHWFVNRKVT